MQKMRHDDDANAYPCAPIEVPSIGRFAAPTKRFSFQFHSSSTAWFDAARVEAAAAASATSLPVCDAAPPVLLFLLPLLVGSTIRLLPILLRALACVGECLLTLSSGRSLTGLLLLNAVTMQGKIQVSTRSFDVTTGKRSNGGRDCHVHVLAK